MTHLLHHQLHRRTGSLWRHLLNRHVNRTQVTIHIDIVIEIQTDILDHNCRQIGAVAVVFRVEDDGTAAAALLRASQRPATGALVGSHRDRGSGVDAKRLGLGRLIGLEHCEGIGEITGVDFLVGRVLVTHHPSGRRAGWRGDEEELVGLRGLQELGALLTQDRSWFAEVDAWSDISA